MKPIEAADRLGVTGRSRSKALYRGRGMRGSSRASQQTRIPKSRVTEVLAVPPAHSQRIVAGLSIHRAKRAPRQSNLIRRCQGGEPIQIGEVPNCFPDRRSRDRVGTLRGSPGTWRLGHWIEEWLWVQCWDLIPPRPQDDEPAPRLRHAEIRCAHHLCLNLIPDLLKFLDEGAQDRRMTPRRHARHVLHHEIARTQSADETVEVENQTVSLVIYQSLPNRGEPLAGRATDDGVYLTAPIHEAVAPSSLPRR